MAHELDGKYRITTTNTYSGPLEKRSDGETEIIDGQTHRRDESGCTWTSSFEILNENEVKMTSIADPSEASIDFLLTAPDGSPTRDCVTYESTLKLAQKGENEIQLSGQIHDSNEIVFLTMRKIIEK